jgi:transposase
MAFVLISDKLWNEIKSLLPSEKPKPLGGRPRVDDRACLTGIVYVLKTGMPWRWVPAELGCGSGVTCWRRLRDWTKAGLWSRIHRKLIAAMGSRGKLDASLCVEDSASVRALFGGTTPGPTPRIGRKTAANVMVSRMVTARRGS